MEMMSNEEKYIIFSIVTLVLLVALITSFNYFKTTNTYIDDSFNNQTKITKGISMNLEQQQEQAIIKL